MPIIGVTASGFFYPQRGVVSVGLERNVYAQLWCIPQQSIPAYGITLNLTDGVTTFSLLDCAVDRGTLVIGSDGNIQQVGLWGSVWRWNGEISGWYNRRNPDGSVVVESKRTVQQLAALLWASMGVATGDVSALPNDDSDLPEVFWQCADSYGELHRLCRERGCRPAMRVQDNAGNVHRLGVGATLPDNTNIKDVISSFDAHPPPRYLKACAGSDLFQSKLKMKPMMLETDGRIVDRDQVSYNPGGVGSATGWTGKDEFDPMGPKSDPVERAAARKSYGRYWLVESQADGTQNVPGYGDVGTVERILPLLDQVAEEFDATTGTYHRQAYLVGKVAISAEPDPLANSGDHELIEVEFRLIRELGLVITSVPLIKYDGDLKKVTADVFLVCSYHVQNPETFQYVHRALEREIAPAGGGTKPLHRPDIVRRVIAQYASDGVTVTGTADNSALVDAALNGQLDSTQTEYQTATAQTRIYRGVQATPIDGAIRQVRIVVDMEDGPETWISRNNEYELGMVREKQRIRNAIIERQAALIELQERERRLLARKGVLG